MKKLIMIILVLTVSTAFASGFIQVHKPHARAVPPGQPNSAIFMELENTTEKELLLTRAESEIAESVELHTHSMKNGMMHMHPVVHIKIPGKSRTALQPGGYHIMLIGLKDNLKEGTSIPLKLFFNNGKSVNLKVPVEKIKMKHKKHMHMHQQENHKHHGGDMHHHENQ